MSIDNNATERPMRSPARIWMLSRARWSIECIFRTYKQNLSFGKMIHRSKEASCLAAEMSFYIYSQIQLDPEKSCGKEGDSVELILGRIRENSLNDSIESLTAFQKPKRLQQLKAKRSKKNTSLKPVDKIAVSA